MSLTSTDPTAVVDPTVRRRLRQRPPRPIQSARGALLTLAGYTIVVSALIGLLTVVGFRGASGALATVLPITVPTAIAAIVALRLIPTRGRTAWVVAVLIAVAVLVGGLLLIREVIGGSLEPNTQFFVAVAIGLAALTGLLAMRNLLRARAWFTGDQVPPLRVGESGARPITARLIDPDAGSAARGDGSATPIEAVARSVSPKSAAQAAPLLAVRDLRKHFPIHGGLLRRQVGTVYAVDGVTFDVQRGETFSLVGESGCGKTTLGRTVLQLTPPTSGRVVFDGYELDDVDPDDMRPLRRRMQIIFQDPFGSLNPRMPISDIIGEGLLAQGLADRATRDRRVEDALELVGLRREYTRRYPHEFSGGQRQRIGVARALALSPDLIVCDEPVSALDVSIQSQVLNLLLDLKRDLNLTYLFISHNLSVVQYFSDRVAVMYLGKLVEVASVEDLYRNPRHPYTVALLSAIPEPDPRRRRRRLVLKGDVPSPAAPPSGCRFHTRCWLREKLGNPERCSTEEPILRPTGPTGQQVACHFSEELAAAVPEPTGDVAVASPVVAAAEPGATIG